MIILSIGFWWAQVKGQGRKSSLSALILQAMVYLIVTGVTRRGGGSIGKQGPVVPLRRQAMLSGVRRLDTIS